MKDTDIIAAIAPDAVSLMDKAIAEIKRLRQENATLTAERDEARRIACEMEERVGCDDSGCPKNGLAEDHAKRRGWNCFKEDIND